MITVLQSGGVECSWAVRNLRARGWRAAFAIGLLAIALSANALVFSAADSLVFHRVPYPNADRLVAIHAGRFDDGVKPALFDQWRMQTDLFSKVEGYTTPSIFLTGSQEPELISMAGLTVGMLDLLGVQPRWGRNFVDGDAHEFELVPVLIAEGLARRRFGDPAAAIGQLLTTSAEPLLVIGVMPAGFAFPDSERVVWRAHDPRGRFAQLTTGVSVVARLAPGVPVAALPDLIKHRSAAIGRAAGISGEYKARARPIRAALVSTDQRRLFLILLSAAICLLLLACANVASLELASAARRTKTYAVQLAVGASRASLMRTAALEGAGLVFAAAAGAAVLAGSAGRVVSSLLPARLITATVNPIDLDGRALIFMTVVAGAVWAVASLPAVLHASRVNLADLLKAGGAPLHSAAGAGTVRGALTVIQIAVVMMLLTGSVVYIRSYRALLAVDKGFDASGVVAVELIMPPQVYVGTGERRALGLEAAERLKTRPGVITAADLAAPPSLSTILLTELEIDDRPSAVPDVRLAEIYADGRYFSVLRIPLLAGRFLREDDPPANVVVGEAFARRYWGDGQAVGARFRRSGQTGWYSIVGVAGNVRDNSTPPGAAPSLQVYIPRLTPRSPVAAGGSSGLVQLMARVDARASASDLSDTLRALDPQLIVKLTFVEDMYARQFGAQLLATRVIGGFGMLAYVVAVAGLYGFMSFLVACRTQEIGVRMALGADRLQILRMVMGSSMRLVTYGIALGTVGAISVSRWIQSQLFEVSAIEPLTIAGVATLLCVTGLLASWQPAGRASQLDAAALLRD